MPNIKLLRDKLMQNDIRYEVTSFLISRELKSERDLAWQKYIDDGQIVDVIYPKEKGGKLELKGKSRNDITVFLGTVKYYEESRRYGKAIIGNLKNEPVSLRSNHEKLEQYQEVVLLEVDEVPPIIKNNRSLHLIEKPKRHRNIGCVLVYVSIIIAIIVVMLRYIR